MKSLKVPIYTVLFSPEKYIPLIRNPIGTACEYLGYVRLGLGLKKEIVCFLKRYEKK